MDHKLSPVHLTWLYLVYGKMFSYHNTHFCCMWNVILYNFGLNFLPNIGIFAIKCVFLNMFGQLFWMLDVRDVVVTIDLQPLDDVGRCYLPCGCVMADVTFVTS